MRFLIVILALHVPTLLFANPMGPTVVRGQVSFSGNGKVLTIANSPGSIINWEGFSIGVGEITSFVQQSAASSVLNRVTGVNPSIILGTLQSNGRVFLINPNGTLFGAGSVVNVGGLVVSSLNLSDQDFLAGKYNFTATVGAGGIVNRGTITTPTGGAVYLIAPDVQNSGVITSPQGEIVLAAGHSVELLDANTPDLQVEITAGGKAVNLGQILADSGTIGIDAGLIKNSGTLQADTATVGANGQILLVASQAAILSGSSKIEAAGTVSSTTGGTVEVSAPQVNLESGSTIDVSGLSGGGTILVGGGAEGAQAAVPDAQFVTIASGANLMANATVAGNGGTVIVWSDNTTQVNGSISAQGGPNGGNGGFIETSGPTLDVSGVSVNTSSPDGAFGTWLLDPTNIWIATSQTAATGAGMPGTDTSANSSGPATFQASGAVSDSLLTTSVLTAALSTTNVLVTTSNAAGTGAGNINVVSGIDYNSGNSLTLNAANNITVLAGSGIVNTGSGAVTLTGAGSGAIAVNAGLSTAGGGINIDSGTGGVMLANATLINAGSGAIAINAGAGAVNLGTGMLETSNATAAAIGITNASTLALGNVVLTGGGTLTVSQTGAGTQNSGTTISGTGALTQAGSGTVTLSAANTYTGTTSINTGTLAAGTVNAVGASSAVTVASGAFFDLGGFSDTIGSLAGAGTVTDSGAAATLTTGSNNTSTTFSGVIENGPGIISLTKQGSGTFTLAGANIYTGTTSINAGTLSVTNAGAIDTAGGAVTVANGATLNINGVALNTVVAGLSVQGTGVGAAGALTGTGTAAYAGPITLTADTTIGETSPPSTLTLGGIISGPFALTQAGSGTLVFTAANTYTGITTINAGTLQIGNGGATGSLGTGNVTDDAALVFDLSSSPTIANLISGSGTVTQAGSGTVTLSAANTYTGITTINAGTLQIGNGGATGSLGTGNVTDDAALVFDLSSSPTIANLINGSGTVTQAGSGTLVFTAANTYTGITTINAGTLQIGNGGATGSLGTGNVTDDAALVFDLSSSPTIANLISGSGTVTQAGSGTVTLSAANTYTGITTINAGTLQIGNGGATGSLGTGNVTDDAALVFDLSSSPTIANLISGSGTVTQAGSGTLVFTAANTYTGITTINAGTLQIGNGGATGSLGTGNVTDDAALVFDLSSSPTIANLISGSGTVTQAGSGTVTLSAANTYTGTTSINTGTLAAGTVNAVGASSAVTVASGAFFDLGGFSDTIGSLAGAGTVTDSGAAATLTTGSNNTSTTFSGVIENGPGIISLTKQGSGTFTLAGANIYTGTTSINAGTLSVTNAGAIDTAGGAVTVANGATLNINGVALNTVVAGLSVQGTGVGAAGALTGTGTAAYAGPITLTADTTIGETSPPSTLTLGGIISGPFALTQAGSGTLVFTAANTYTGITTINAGTLQIGNGGATGSLGTGNVTDDAALVFDLSSSPTIANLISGSGTVTQAGSGTVTLSAANTYTGTTSINTGTLAAGTVNAVGASSAVTVASGAFFDLGGFSDTIGSLAGAGTVTDSGAAATLTTGSNNTSTTFSGVIENGPGIISLTKQGSGTFTLAGANIYTGTTSINAGTLSVTNAGAIDTAGGAVTVANGATLNINGVALNTVVAGLSVQGTGVGAAGALTGTGTAAYAGPITLTADTTIGETSPPSTLTLGGIISGPFALTQAGSGTLVFTAANTYTGITTINAGTLQIGNGGATGSLGTGNVTDDAALVFDLSSSPTIANLISGSGTVTQAGSGTVTLSAANTYTGTTSINTGTLAAGTVNAVGASSAVTVASGAFFDLGGFSDTIGSLAGAGTVTDSGAAATLTTGSNNTSTTFSGVIENGPGIISLTKQGSGTFTLAGANIYTGTTSINAGTLSVTNAGAIDTAGGAVTVANGATLNINGVALNTVVAGLSVQGTGVGAAGALTGTGTAAYAGPITLTADTTIGETSPPSTLTLGGIISGPFALTQAGSGTLVFTAANTYTGITTINAGTLQIGNGGATGSLGTGNVTDDAALVFDLSSSPTIANLISGSGTVTQAGSGTVTLSAANTYTGTTSINTGTLAAGTVNAVGASSAVTVASGAFFDLGGFSDTIGSLAGAGTVTDSGAAATLTTGSNNTSTTFSGVIENGPGIISLTKQGSGTFTLAGANIYTGTTSINAGTLSVTNAGAIDTAGGAVTVANGATLNINGVALNTVVAGLSVQGTGVGAAGALTGTGTAAYAGPITLTADTTIGETSPPSTLTLGGIISGPFALTQAGSGTLVFTAANTYTGITTINAGTLQIGNGGATGSLGTGNVTDDAALVFDLSSSPTIANLISGSGTVTQAGSGTVTLSAANTYTGTTSINTGTLAAGTVNAVGASSAVTVASGAFFDLGGFSDTIGSLAGAGTVTDSGAAATLTTGSNNTSTTFSGVIENGPGIISLTKQGSGTFTLAGANIYTGTTSINAGTLSVTNAGAIDTAGGAVTVANGATLNINGVALNTVVAGLSVQGTGVGAAGALTGTGTAAYAGPITLTADTTIGETSPPSTLTLGGIISGPFALTQAGSGTLVFTAANTYTGITTINAGTLQIGNGGATGSLGTGNVTDDAALVFDLSSSPTIANLISGSGTVTQAGSGTVTLSAANTYTGTTSINTGTLAAGTVNAVGASSAVTVASGAFFDLGGFSDTIGSLAGAGTVTDSGAAATLTTGSNNTSTTFSGVIENGPGIISLTKQGSGTFTLAGANIYTGTTSINAGTLAAGTVNAVGASSAVTVASGAFFDLGGFSDTIGSLAGAGTVTDSGAAATLTTGSNNTSTTFSGVIENGPGIISLTKQGSGTFTLAGANTYSGVTNVNSGTLVAANATALGSPVNGTTVASGATLQISNVGIGAESLTLNGVGVGGAGALVGTGTASLGGPVVLASASALGATAPTDDLTLNGSVNGAAALTQTGLGTVTFGGIVGGITPLLSFTSEAGGTTVMNGGALTTTGAQLFNGAVILGESTLLTTANSNITAGGVVNAEGNPLTLVAGNANISFANAGNSLATVAVVNANNATFVNANAMTLGTSSLSGTLSITASGSVIQTGAVAVLGTTSITAEAGDITLNNNGNSFTGNVSLNNAGTNNVIFDNSIATSFTTSTIGGNLIAISSGNITLNGAITAAGTLTLESAGNFFNNVGADALTAGDNWLIYSTNPVLNNLNGLVSNFIQYNASYGISPVLGSGNGFLYTLAPTITPLLTGTVSKVYDATTTAPLAAGNYLASGVIGDDTVTLNNPTSGIYSTVNVGTNENVSVSGISISSATNGSAIVYGYQLSSTSANGNIGIITPRPITISSDPGLGKTYGTDDPTSAETAYDVTAGSLVGGNNLTGDMGRAAGENVGVYAFTQNSVSVSDGNGGNNYSITFNGTSNPFEITAASLTATIGGQTKVYGTNDPALSGIRVNLSGLVDVTVTDINGNHTLINDTGNVSTSLASLSRVAGENTGSYGITGGTLTALSGSAAANYTASLSTAGDTLTITPASLSVVANNASRQANQPNPSLTVSYSGFQLGDTPNSLSGVLVIATPANVSSPPGIYPIVPSGQSSANYVIVYTDGVLTVRGFVPGALTQITTVGSSAASSVEFTSPQLGVLQSIDEEYLAEELLNCLTETSGSENSPRCNGSGVVKVSSPTTTNAAQ